MKHISTCRCLLAFVLFTLCTLSSKAYDVVVAKDGSGNYTTVQAAIDGAPVNSTVPYIIYIKNGKYREKITVASNKTFIQLLGQSVANVIITFGDYGGELTACGSTVGTQNSASVSINGNDFSAINVTFVNDHVYGTPDNNNQQAVAILVNADRAAFKNCRFIGNQDTMYLKGSGFPRHYFKNCYIDGLTDYIFGSSIAVFDSCVLYNKNRTGIATSYMTAANTDTTTGQHFGLVFRGCRIAGNDGGTQFYLGRPWQNTPNVVYINDTIINQANILPAGWATTSAGSATFATSYFAEFQTRNSDGTLTNVSGRQPGSHQLTVADTPRYNLPYMFSGWNPCNVASGFCGTNPPDIAVSNFIGTKGTTSSQFNWNISWPMHGITYNLYRSTDNVTYTPIYTTTAATDTTVNFSYVDNTIPPSGSIYYYYVAASNTGYATHITDTLQISSAATILVNASANLQYCGFSQGLGTPSAPQTYTVSGSNLTNNIIITPPVNFEVSVNGTNWFTNASPLTLTQSGGTVALTTVSIRLNATVAGSYSGNIVNASTGATSVNVPVIGVASPPPTSFLIQAWGLTANNNDSSAVRSVGVTQSPSSFHRLAVADGSTSGVNAYSGQYGQTFAPVAAGGWGTGVGGPGGTLSRDYYEQFTVTAASNYTVRIDSVTFNSSFYGTASGLKMDLVYSKNGFSAPADSTEYTTMYTTNTASTVPGSGSFPKAFSLAQNNNGPGIGDYYALALNNSTGIFLTPGQILTVRLYWTCSSSGTSGRYAQLKNVIVKGAAINAVAGDYETHQTGDWTDLNTWERFDGNNWINPAPSYPVYNNAGAIKILSGHTVTVSATLANGSGYTHLTTIKQGGQLNVNAGATLNIANDGTPASTTTDLQVDGTLNLMGAMGTNGNVSVIVNGTFINSGTGLNLSNGGDVVTIDSLATFQQNANLANVPKASWMPGSNLLVTGIVSNQTGIFSNTVNYANIIWNCPAEASYYAFRNTLSNNVQGSFTVANTGSTYISFANASGAVTLPGGFIQTGGTVNFRESGNVLDTLNTAGNFAVTGGTFNSAAGVGSALAIQLYGINKVLAYNQAGATNTNWNILGGYTLASGLALPSSGFGLNVLGGLNAGPFVINGSGNFALLAGALFGSGAPTGIDGNITNSGLKIFDPAANYAFGGVTPQVTGTLMPPVAAGLLLNNSSDVTLTSSLILNGPLGFLAGKLYLGNNTLTANADTGYSLLNYVVTNGTGSLKLNNVGATTVIFPVGPSNTSLNSVAISNSGVADNFSVNVKTSFDNPVPDPNKVVNRQWTISEGTAGGSNATISLSWLTADQAPGFNPLASTSIIHFNGVSWDYLPAVVTGAGTAVNPYVATATGVTSFSPFGVINNSALPLTLISFNAGYDGNTVRTVWETANELNISKFFVQRSSDGINFTDVGNVYPQNGIRNSYALTDQTPLSGISYYRLRTSDRDGATTYSRIVSVNSKLKGVITINPNPVVNVLNLNYPKASSQASINILSVDGRIISKNAIPEGSVFKTIDISILGCGVYEIQYINGNSTLTSKFVKQ